MSTFKPDPLTLLPKIAENVKKDSNLEAFTEQWAQSWCQALNEDPSFRSAAATWEGDVVVVMTRSNAAGAPERAVWIDIAQGECRAARVASEADMAGAGYVLAAAGPVWKEILSGRQNPLTALMTGKLRLIRGSLAALVPYGAMARELIRLATEMEATFPDGWG